MLIIVCILMDFRGIWMCSGKKCLKKGGKNKCAREGTTMGRTMATTRDDVTSHESAQQIMAPLLEIFGILIFGTATCCRSRLPRRVDLLSQRVR